MMGAGQESAAYSIRAQAQQEIEPTVSLVLAELVDMVVHGTGPRAKSVLRIGEYEVTIPKVTTGFHMNIVDEDGATQIVSFRALADGTHSPIEVAGVNEGDFLLAINDQSVTQTPFNRVCEMLGEVPVGSFARLRLSRKGESNGPL